jgi:hypothetical protein
MVMEAEMSISTHLISTNKPARTNSSGQPLNVKSGKFFEKTKTSKKNDNKTTGLNAPISKQDLFSLAADLKNGTISREEANDRFIATVINNSISNKLSTKDCEKLVNDIRDFFAQDPDFLKNLEKNLKCLV